MKRTIALLAFTISILTATNTPAQDWAKARLDKSPRHIEWVNVKQRDRTIKSSIAFPEVKDKATAVVVIHEIFGLTDWVRGVTDQLAEAGYIAIAPDLLSGMAPGGGGSAELGGPDGARAVIGKLPPDQITTDLNAVVDYVSKLPSCNGKVAVMGFCWGGGQAFRFATNNKDIKAAMAFYGTGPETDADIKRIHAPVYGFYGGNDNRVNATIPTSEKLMKDAGKKYEPVVYEGAGHGFMRAGEDPAGNEPNKKARDQAWQRVKDILTKI
jgi:carboxymethylenebutenolidase